MQQHFLKSLTPAREAAKVCILIKRFYPQETIGGAEAFAVRLAKSLVIAGSSVIVLSARYKKHWRIKEHIKVENSVEAKCFKVTRLPCPPIRFLRSLVYVICLFLALLRTQRKYDVVFVNYASLDAATAVLAKLFSSKPVICKIAGPGPHGDIGQLKQRWYGTIILRILRNVDRFIALNPEITEALIDCGISRESITFIPNGVDDIHFYPGNNSIKEKARDRLGIKQAEKVIVTVGRLSAEKGLTTLIKAVHLLKSDGVSCKVFILGEGNERRHLNSMIKEYELEDRITITSESSDIRNYLHAGEIFVLPSRWEGLSNALLEAMASGLPCICTDIPGNNAVIRHCENGILIPVDDHIELACSLELLMKDAKIRGKLGVNARLTICDRYSMARTTCSYISLFRELALKCPSASSFPRDKRESIKPTDARKPEEHTICN